MRDTAISLKFLSDISVDIQWFLLKIFKDSPENWPKIHQKSLWILQGISGKSQRINVENSPQFPRRFSFHLQPKFLRGFPSTVYPPSPEIPRRIRVILPAG